MTGLLGNIINIILTVVKLLGNLFTGINMLFSDGSAYINFIISSFNVLPAILLPFCVLSITTYFLLMVLGRN